MRWFRYLFRMLRGADMQTGCKHNWISDTSNFGRRHCNRCGRTSFLMENKCPEIWEAKYTWSID